ncbi:protein stum [Neocloeon triangulifer]|uniref:protein stum n=1 Tax=Neocloeon triangulifer TaxID=2078957 RepID=UPI00286F4572|nr:protein stum [Neocloeon triangulifer]
MATEVRRFEMQRPQTTASRSAEALSELQAMRQRLRPVTPSPKPSPRQIWHPQENFIGPLRNYIPAEMNKDGDYRLSRTRSPSDFVVPRPLASISDEKPVPRPRTTRGRSPVRRVVPLNDRPTLSSANKEKPKIGSPERPVTRGKSSERPKSQRGSPEKKVSPALSQIEMISPSRTLTKKVVVVDPDTVRSPEERITTRMAAEPAVCRTCGMSPERNAFKRPLTSTGLFSDTITLSPRLQRATSPSPERHHRSVSPIKFVIPMGQAGDSSFPGLTLEIVSRGNTPDRDATLTIFSPRDDALCIATSSPKRSPAKGKPPKQPGVHLAETSPRTHWVVDRPCRTPSPVQAKYPPSRVASPIKSINAYMRPPSRGPSPPGRPRSTSRGRSPSFDFNLIRLSTAPARRRVSPPSRPCCARSTAKSAAAKEATKKKAAMKLVETDPEYVFHHPSMPIVKRGPDLPPPHTKLRPEAPQTRPRSRSKNSASFVVWKEQRIDLPERIQSPKKENKKPGEGGPDMVKAATEAEKALAKSAAANKKVDVAAAAAAQIEAASAAASAAKKFGSRRGTPTKSSIDLGAVTAGSTTSLRNAIGSVTSMKGAFAGGQGSAKGSTTSIPSAAAANSPKPNVKKSMRMIATANSSTTSIRSHLSKSVAFEKAAAATGEIQEGAGTPTKSVGTPSKGRETPGKESSSKVSLKSASSEASLKMAKASNENAAKSFNSAIKNVKGNVPQKKIFSTINSAINMQQEKVSVTSADMAAILHDEHAAGEKDELPELISEKRRGSRRFSALGRIAGMGARFGFKNKKEGESGDKKSLSRSSSKSSLGDKAGTLSKSGSQSSLGKLRSASGILGSLSSLVSTKSRGDRSDKSDSEGASSPSTSKKHGRLSANAAMRAMSAAKSLVRSPRAQSSTSLNKSQKDGDESESESAPGSKKGSMWKLPTRDSSSAIINMMTKDSRSSSVASIAATPPSTRVSRLNSAARTVRNFVRLGSRRNSQASLNSQMPTPDSSIPSTPKTPRTPLSLKKVSAKAGKIAVFGKRYRRNPEPEEEEAGAANPAAPAEMEVVNEVDSRGSSKRGSVKGSQVTLGSRVSKKMFGSRGNETLGEELVARLDSISGSEMDESMSSSVAATTCCCFRGAWAQRLAGRRWPCCGPCIRPLPPAKDKDKEEQWAKTRKHDLDVEMQGTEETAEQKPRLVDRLKCWRRRKRHGSASSEAPVVAAAAKNSVAPKRTMGQRLKSVFKCAAMRGCCAQLSCRGCCAKVSCACCCPCFASCACCTKCCKRGAVGDATPNPLDSKRPSLQSKRKSRSTINNEPIVRKLDVSLLEANSLIQSAIPVLPVKLAWICLILNIFIPGLGTILSGAFCLCIGRPRFSVEDRPEERIGTFFLDLMVGVGQLFTVLFCLVGWGWSIWWGTIMLKLARKNRRLMARAADDVAKPVNPRRPSDPANKK